MPEPIRILHVFVKMDRGGAESMVMQLYRKIDHSKIQFDFVVHTREEGAFDKEISDLGGNMFYVQKYEGLNHLKYIQEWRVF